MQLDAVALVFNLVAAMLIALPAALLMAVTNEMDRSKSRLLLTVVLLAVCVVAGTYLMLGDNELE